MAYFNPEPPYHHGTPARIGILLLNLGTPDAPNAPALRRYLKQFLSDRRIVEIPRLIWWLILNGIILNIRPRKSAEKYAMIWSKEGSPLLVHGQRQATLLEGFLRDRIARPYAVELGMRYGNPSVASALDKLKAQNCDRILLLPLYPQYASSSTASALDAVWQALLHMRNIPEIRSIRHYHDHPAYIAALAGSVREHWAAHGRPDKLLMSFHGVPKFSLDKGDPYHCECHKTGRLLAEALELEKEQYLVCFQSRFGRAEWLQPYFAPTLEALGRSGTRRVDVICPGFSSDCLETLEEIAMEGKASFLGAGGQEYHYIPALNEREDWIRALSEITLEHLQGWLGAQVPESELEISRRRALEMGAAQ